MSVTSAPSRKALCSVEYAAVITAGGRVDARFQAEIGTAVKALAPIGESTMLDRAIDAVRGAGIEQIAVVGGSEVRQRCAHRVELVIDESSDGAENQSRALRAFEPDRALLYVTSDMPFVSAGALRAFLQGVPDGALALPLSEIDDFKRRFPGAPRFGVTLAGECVVNGGAFAIPPGGAARVESLALAFFSARKNVWAMARLTGPALLLAFVFRRLSVASLERNAQRMLGIPAKAVRNASPELAYDVDTLEEYRYAIAHT